MVMELFGKNGEQGYPGLGVRPKSAAGFSWMKVPGHPYRGTLMPAMQMMALQILGLLLYCTATKAQQGYYRKSPEEKAMRFTAEMSRVILPDSLCRSRVHEVNVWLSKSFDSLYATRPDPETKRRAYIYFFRTRDSLFRGILNREQVLRYDDWQREQRLKRQEEKRRESEKPKEGGMQMPKEEQRLDNRPGDHRASSPPQEDG